MKKATTKTTAAAIENELLSIVSEYHRERPAGCPFDVIWTRLSGRAAVTYGQFQDAIRALYAAGRVRLGAWPKMLDDMPHPELAMFVSAKVMYYVHPTTTAAG